MNFLQPPAYENTPIHRADARLKVLALLVFSILVSLANSWLLMGICAAVVIVCALVARLPLRSLLVPLVPVAVLAAFAFGFGTWNNPTPNGISQAGIVAVRMLLLVEASFVVCLTTSSEQFMNTLGKFLGPLARIGVPVKRICFILNLALRFIPYIAQQFLEVRHAQLARGSLASGVGLGRRFQNVGVALAATFIGLFRHGDAMSQAMDARCFDLKR